MHGPSCASTLPTTSKPWPSIRIAFETLRYDSVTLRPRAEKRAVCGGIHTPAYGGWWYCRGVARPIVIVKLARATSLAGRQRRGQVRGGPAGGRERQRKVEDRGAADADERRLVRHGERLGDRVRLGAEAHDRGREKGRRLGECRLHVAAAVAVDVDDRRRARRRRRREDRQLKRRRGAPLRHDRRLVGADGQGGSAKGGVVARCRARGDRDGAAERERRLGRRGGRGGRCARCRVGPRERAAEDAERLPSVDGGRAAERRPLRRERLGGRLAAARPPDFGRVELDDGAAELDGGGWRERGGEQDLRRELPRLCRERSGGGARGVGAERRGGAGEVGTGDEERRVGDSG